LEGEGLREESIQGEANKELLCYHQFILERGRGERCRKKEGP